MKSGMLISATSLPLETEPDALLDMFARLAISIGVNVQPRQELIVAAPIEAAGFVRRLASTAYARGASLVTALYADPELLRTRLLDADEVLDRKEEWLAGSVAQRLREGAAYLSVLGPRPGASRRRGIGPHPPCAQGANARPNDAHGGHRQ